MFRLLPIKIVLLLSFCFALQLSAENKQVVAEIHVSNNDSIFKYNYLYNNQAQPVVETKTLKNGTTWENISQTEWFRQADLHAGQVERIWADNKWNGRYSIRYQQIDAKIIETHFVIENNIETEIRKIEFASTNNLKTTQTEYSKANNNWNKVLETTFFYSSNNLTDSTIVIRYENGTLKSSYKTDYNYYPNASLKSIIVQVKNDFELMYINVSKSVYSYKANAIESLRNYSWNSKSSIWENDTKLEYLYDATGNIQEEISWQWNSMYWQQVLRYNYLYDTKNQLYKKLVSTPIYRDWRNTNSVNYLRQPDSHNMTIESVYGFWGGKAGDKLNTHIAFPFNDETIIRKAETIQLSYVPFIESAVTVNNASQPSLVRVYPNPSHGVFYISNFEASNSTWTLSGLNGTVYKNSGSNINSSVIDISELPNGIYLLNIRSASEIGTHKIVKY